MHCLSRSVRIYSSLSFRHTLRLRSVLTELVAVSGCRYRPGMQNSQRPNGWLRQLPLLASQSYRHTTCSLVVTGTVPAGHFDSPRYRFLIWRCIFDPVTKTHDWIMQPTLSAADLKSRSDWLRKMHDLLNRGCASRQSEKHIIGPCNRTSQRLNSKHPPDDHSESTIRQYNRDFLKAMRTTAAVLARLESATRTNIFATRVMERTHSRPMQQR